METKVAMVVGWIMPSTMSKLRVLKLKLNIHTRLLLEPAKYKVVPSRLRVTLMLPKVIAQDYSML
jgi:hypothetical protein